MNKLLLLAFLLFLLYLLVKNQQTAVVQTAGSIVSDVSNVTIKNLVETSMLLKQFQ
jgi:hypothetical protein